MVLGMGIGDLSFLERAIGVSHGVSRFRRKSSVFVVVPRVFRVSLPRESADDDKDVRMSDCSVAIISTLASLAS